jgi:hypothetical protein
MRQSVQNALSPKVSSLAQQASRLLVASHADKRIERPGQITIADWWTLFRCTKPVYILVPLRSKSCLIYRVSR